MTHRLATSLIALSTAFAAPVFADVSASDVWSNQQAFMGAMGLNASGTLSGDTLSGVQINGILPMGIASFQIITDDITMTENGDGTVTISYPSPMSMTVAGSADGEGSFSVTMSMTHDGYDIIASGDAGDVVYEMNGNNLRFDFIDMALSEPGMSDTPMKVDGYFAISDWTGTSRVTEGNLITYSSTSEVGESSADFTFAIDDVISRNTQTAGPVQSTIAATFPVGGSDLLNLSQALRDGLSVVLESTGEGSSSEAETTLQGDLFNSQTTQTGPQEFNLTLNEDGIALDGEAADFALVMNDPLIFSGDLEFGIETLSLNYDVPLNASEEEQDFRVATSLQGLTLGDTIWNLFDPASMLPRDPAEVTFDVTGSGTNGADLLDFMALAQMFGPPPIEVDQVTIENLRIAAVGAEATATGAMTFDWTDFQTIPGIARPEGQVTVNLNGANKLMDTLAAMGLIPEEELMMPRMMMGMFATPVGDDMLETVLEVNEQGHVLANGQRLQ